MSNERSVGDFLIFTKEGKSNVCSLVSVAKLICQNSATIMTADNGDIYHFNGPELQVTYKSGGKKKYDVAGHVKYRPGMLGVHLAKWEQDAIYHDTKDNLDINFNLLEERKTIIEIPL